MIFNEQVRAVGGNDFSISKRKTSPVAENEGTEESDVKKRKLTDEAENITIQANNDIGVSNVGSDADKPIVKENKLNHKIEKEEVQGDSTSIMNLKSGDNPAANPENDATATRNSQDEDNNSPGDNHDINLEDVLR